MKLSTYAKQQGVTYTTAVKWFHAGLIPNSRQLSTGTILVDEAPVVVTPSTNVVIYCRVSNHNRRDEMEYQVQRCESYCVAKGYSINKIYKEVASGMNDNRKEFWKMMDSSPSIIVIEHKDRLTRFGFNYLDRLSSKLGTSIEVMNRDKEDDQDLLKDLVAIITSFCCRLYGMRRGQHKAKQMKTELMRNDI